MPPPRPVLYCYDGSDGAKRALQVGGQLFPDGPGLVVAVWVSVWSAVSAVAYAALPQAAAEEADRASEERARELAAEGADIVGGDADRRAVRSEGAVWETVLQLAEKTDARAIIVGSRGLTGLRSQLLGSVSHGLIHHSHRPVVVVPPA